MLILHYILLCNVICSSSGKSQSAVSKILSTYETPKVFLSGDPTATTATSTLPKGKILRTQKIRTWSSRGASSTLPTKEKSQTEVPFSTLPTVTEAVSFNIRKEETKDTFLPGNSSVTAATMLPSSIVTRKITTSGFYFTTSWTLPPLPRNTDTDTISKSLSDVLEQNPNVIESFATEFYSLCPNNTQMCYTKLSPSRLSYSGLTCCLYCTCTETCKLEKNCCPSKATKVAQYETSKYFTFLFCQSTYKLLTYTTATELQHKGYKDENGYLFVSTCLASALEEDKSLCKNMARTDTFSVFDTVPVTDIRDNTHFANGFCAACHHIPKESIKPWNIDISCLRIKILLEEEDIENFVRRNPDCFVRYMPPDEISDSTLFSCTPNVIDRCNTFGEWHTYDEKIESLCLDARLEKIYKVKIDNVTYRFKNVFCAVCNGFKKEEVEDCEPNIVGPLNPPAFHSLFTFSGPNVADMGINRRRCAVGKVFIPVLGMCQNVHCALPYLADILRNKCVLRAVASTSQSVYIPVMTSLNQSIPFSYQDELKSIVIQILDSVYSNSCRCDVSIAYELDSAYHPNMTEQTLQDKHIKALYISLHLIESSTDFDYATFVAAANTVHIVNVLNSKVMIKLNHGQFDPLFLTEDRGQGEQIIIKKNHYNNAALVHYPSIMDKCACANKSEPSTGYPLQFMECPSVLVALENINITRVASGLRIGQSRHFIPLNNVRSLNYTHVHICVDSINSEDLLSHGNLFFKRIEFLCIFVSLLTMLVS